MLSISKPTLYEQKPESWNRIAAMGYESLRDMAKSFTLCADMDRALGYENASSRWHRGVGRPGTSSARRADLWLKEQVKPPEPIKQAAPQGALLLVACDHATADKVRRVLAVLGCEVTDI